MYKGHISTILKEPRFLFILSLLMMLIAPAFAVNFIANEVTNLAVTNRDFQGNYHDSWAEISNSLNCARFNTEGLCNAGAGNYNIYDSSALTKSNRICQNLSGLNFYTGNFNISFYLASVNLGGGIPRTTLRFELRNTTNYYKNGDVFNWDAGTGVTLGARNQSINNMVNVYQFCIYGAQLGEGGGYWGLNWANISLVTPVSYYFDFEDDFPTTSVYYTPYVPVAVSSNRTTATYQYRMNYWGADTWLNLTTTGANSTASWGSTDLWYLDAGAYTIFIRDDLGSTINASFGVSRLDTPTNVELKLVGSLYSCEFDKMPLVYGNLYQKYPIEIWESSTFSDYILGSQYTLEYDAETGKYSYLFGWDAEGDTTNLTCLVSQQQYLSTPLLSYNSNFGSSSISQINPYIRLYNNGQQIQQGYNAINISIDDSADFKFNDLGLQYYITQKIDQRIPEYNRAFGVVATAGISYYNISLIEGRNELRVISALSNEELGAWTIDAYGISDINNLTLWSENAYICSYATCNYNDLGGARGIIKINSSATNNIILVRAYVIDNGNKTLIFERLFNNMYDLDSNNNQITLYTNEPYSESDTALNEFMRRYPSTLEQNKIDFAKSLNFGFTDRRTDGYRFKIYIPPNEKIEIVSSYADAWKNITLIGRYDLQGAIYYSPTGTDILLTASCTLPQAATLMQRLDNVACITTNWWNTNADTFAYIILFITLLVVGSTIVMLIKRS